MDDEVIYKFIFENSEDAIFIISLAGEILNLNKQASKILGSSKEDLLLQNFFEIHDPIYHDVVKNYLTRLIKSKKDIIKELKLERNKNKVSIKLRAQLISYNDSDAIICSFRNISEKRNMEQKMRNLIDAIENSVNAVAFADLNGKLTYVNSTFTEMWEYNDSTEVLGESSINFWKYRGDAKKVIKKLHKEGNWTGNLIAKGKTGRKFEVEVYASMILDSKGKEKAMIGWFYDITEKKQIEKDLKETKERYKLLFETMTQGVVFHKPNGRIFSANPAAEKILGIGEKTMIGKNSDDPIWKTIQEDGSHFPAHEHPAQISIRTGKRVQDTIMGVYDPKKLKYRWININSIPLYKDGEKKLNQVYAIFEDITERKKVNDDLKKNKEKLQGILDAITDPVAMIDKDYQVIWGNNKLKSSFGKDITKMKCFEAFYDSDRPCEVCIKNQSLQDGQVHEDEKAVIIGPNKEKHYFWCTSSVVEKDSYGNPITAIEVGRDITKRKKAEEALKKSQEKLQGILDAIIDLVIMVDKDYNFIWVNDIAKRILGSDIIGKKCYHLLSPFTKPCEPCILAQSFKDGKVHENEIELEINNSREKAQFWCSSNIVETDDDGKPKTAIKICRDITDRKKILKKLECSEKKYREMAELLPDAIYETDKDFNLTYGNPAGLRLFRNTLENFRNKINVLDYIPISYKEEVNNWLKKTLNGTTSKSLEVPMIRKDGSSFYARIHARLIYDGDRKIGIRGTVNDIDKLIRTKQRLKFYKDLIAHDITNILSNISSAIQLIQYKKKEDTPQQLEKMLDLINFQVDDGINLLSNVQKMAEVEEKDLKIIKVDPIKILREVINKSPFSQKKNVSITLNTDKTEIFVMASPLLKDVFENIIINGIKHNLSDKKRVKVEISKLNLSDKTFVKFDFIDNGVGIPDNIKSKIFTRDHQSNVPSKGMGIGLSLVKKIIETYNGLIKVKDNLPKGSIFSVILPIA